MLHDLVIGLVVAVPIFAATAVLDQRMADRQELAENLRFVRDRASEPGGGKPFAGLDLRGANLASLRLGCTNPPSETDLIEGRCANFRGADLSGADLTGANLTGANLSDASLVGANLTLTDLTGVTLTGADLRGAVFADDAFPWVAPQGLADVEFLSVCWDQETRWPRTSILSVLLPAIRSPAIMTFRPEAAFWAKGARRGARVPRR